MRQVVLGVAQVGGEDRRAQPLADVVLHCHGVLDVAELHHVEDGGEGLFLDDVPVILRLDDGRLDEEAFAVDAIAAGQHLAAGFLRALDRVEEAVYGLFTGQRAHQGVLVERIADAHLAVGIDQGLDGLVVDRLVDEQAARCRAALAGGADGAEDHGGNGQFDVSRFVHDDGVVAAELEQALAHPSGDTLADHAADLARAGEGEQVDALVVDEALSQVVGRFHERGEYRRVVGVGQGLVDDVLHRRAAQHALRARLPDGGVAADGRNEGVPGVDGHGEVEGRDHADHAQRVPLLVQAVSGPLGVHGVAVEHARLAQREVADVDHLLDLAVALGLDLAHFQRDQGAQSVLVVAQGVVDQPHGVTTLRGRDLAPGQSGFLGGLDDLLVVLHGSAAHPGDDAAVGGVHRLDEVVFAHRGILAGAETGARIDILESEAFEKLLVIAHDRFLLRVYPLVKPGIIASCAGQFRPAP